MIVNEKTLLGHRGQPGLDIFFKALDSSPHFSDLLKKASFPPQLTERGDIFPKVSRESQLIYSCSKRTL